MYIYILACYAYPKIHKFQNIIPYSYPWIYATKHVPKNLYMLDSHFTPYKCPNPHQCNMPPPPPPKNSFWAICMNPKPSFIFILVH